MSPPPLESTEASILTQKAQTESISGEAWMFVFFPEESKRAQRHWAAEMEGEGQDSVDHRGDNVHQDAGPGNAFYEPVNKYCSQKQRGLLGLKSERLWFFSTPSYLTNEVCGWACGLICRGKMWCGRIQKGMWESWVAVSQSTHQTLPLVHFIINLEAKL